MSKTQRRWLRISVIIGLVAATFTTLAIITIYGALAPSNYIGGISSAANCTTWSAISIFSGDTPIIEVLVPVAIVALIIIIVAFFCLMQSACLGGMAE
jgi:hypothetical protein